MKKRTKSPILIYNLFIVALLVIGSFAFLIINLHLTPAEELPLPEDVLGVNPESIPHSPEELQEEYLAKEWGNIIANAPFIGPIHTAFINHPLVFKIIFAEPYSFSLVFALIVLLWILVAFNATKILNSVELIDKKYSWIEGILVAIILAQTKLYSFLAEGSVKLVLSKEAIVARIIIIIILIFVFIIVSYLGGLISKYIKEKKEEKKEQETEKIKKEAPKVKKELSEIEKLAEELAHIEALRENEYREARGISQSSPKRENEYREARGISQSSPKSLKN